MRNRATIRDVAVAAGCSIATVSRALNNGSHVSAAMRARVIAAGEKLGFRTSAVGRALQSRRSGVLGVMIPSIANPVFAEAVQGAQEEASARGRQLLLACVDYEPSRERAVVEMLLDQGVDGLLMTVADAAGSPALDAARAAGAPAVLMFNDAARDVAAVAVDTVAAGSAVAATLLDAGRRRVGFVAGRFATSDRSRGRYEGLRGALTAAGAPPPVLVEVDYRETDHSKTLAALLARSPRIDALVCSNDMLALAVIAALRTLGRWRPEDIGVIGFDGLALGAMVAPSLATVATPNRAMGREAARLLIDALDENEAPAAGTVWLPHEIRPGGSLAARPVPPRRARQRASGGTTPESENANAFATATEIDP